MKRLVSVVAIAALATLFGAVPAWATDVNMASSAGPVTQTDIGTPTYDSTSGYWCSHINVIKYRSNTTGSWYVWRFENKTHWCWDYKQVVSESGDYAVLDLGPLWHIERGPGWSMAWWSKPIVRHSHARATFAYTVNGNVIQEDAVDICIYTSYNGNKGECA